MSSSAKTFEEVVGVFGEAALNAAEKAQVAILRKALEEVRPVLDKLRAKQPLTVEEKAQLRAASNADLRIREIRGKAFDVPLASKGDLQSETRCRGTGIAAGDSPHTLAPAHLEAL